MTKECIFCNKETIFFIWSTSRNINKKELDKIITSDKKGVCICIHCAIKNKVLIERPTPDLSKPFKHTLWIDMPKREESRIW